MDKEGIKIVEKACSDVAIIDCIKVDNPEHDPETLMDLLALVKDSHSWMITDVKIHFDAHGNPEDYSDELKHAIELQKILNEF